ncbi:LemA family protein [Salegentibacter mishustinae]|jgi:LemA protein|uniref:LemA family protein n=1 Tax=Salegentibacter mishustinae TaxID=270918 RepID=A0A0Q9ZEU0_9FLAO|nr:LemA family protein [Salegentibacter mishustinae]KRG30809.1 LemA family protein [Salegentibacter mishustinae]MDX1426720.1 LemA family protein [Salegentibacter mishustinae]PNW23693.1 LemA family protein [Salegentibacter mishustinae]PZX66789.1 LemA protein [Salegentibacter mishustinae]UBZ08538.1 LemA family protein [Salegentibacter mishustinae]
MKKWLIPVIVIVVLGIIVYSLTAGVNNTAVEYEESVLKNWADVENAYQRRSDLIPNLVSTVEGSADFERGTLTDVIEARAKATSVNVDAGNLNQEQIQQFQQAQGGLSSALSRLLVSVERYPDIKSNQNFLQLQSQLEGTENRISVARNRYNEAVRQYNTYIRKFPNNIFAGMFGFERKAPFEAEEGAENAPDVEFDF